MCGSLLVSVGNRKKPGSLRSSFLVRRQPPSSPKRLATLKVCRLVCRLGRLLGR